MTKREGWLLICLLAGFWLLPFLTILLVNGAVSDEFFEPFAIAVIFLDQVEVYAISVFAAFKIMTAAALKANARLGLMITLLIVSSASGFSLLYLRSLAGIPPSLSRLLY